uniref:Uncharacterized protein n=1 Tax=viral metagenome TaxID=1070528 RepID=A0A6M3JF29_9ZZZZ
MIIGKGIACLGVCLAGSIIGYQNAQLGGFVIVTGVFIVCIFF